MRAVVCPRCGSKAPPDALFCPACGAELRGPGRHEERKLVSVLFVDMVGSTARADGADPEDVLALNQLYHQELRERIERFGGVVEKFIGDAVMAVFGAPLARDDDAERAVRAALSILEGIEELNLRRPELDLQVRAAVCTGEAVVTLDAAPGEPLATGDVVNTAARLQSAAPPGRVIVGDQTRTLTQNVIGFEAAMRVDAKGKREAVPAWLVSEPVAMPAERAVSRTRLVGRLREMELITTVWDGVCAADRPHLITVLGPPGIGKSRMGREMTDAVEREQGQALWGRSLPYDERTPYLAIAEMLRAAANVFANDPPDVAREKIAESVRSLFPDEDVADTTRYLSLLLGLGIDEPTDDPILLQFAARRFVEELAMRRPLLLVFEDVHWADDTLLDLIDYLVTRVRDHRVLFLALARPEFLQRRPTWGSGMMGHTTLPLDPLSTDEATEMVGQLLAGTEASTIAKVVKTAEGNPLFIEELVASLDGGTSDELPATVRAAILARIDALPPDARTTLLHASVMGQTFWRDVIASALDLQDLDGALDALEARGLIERHTQSRVAGDVEYAFKHVLIRDAAYATLPRTTRRDLHAAIAATIEDAVSDASEVAWVLAYHWREAGEASRAMGYYLAAAERARDALALEEMYDLYSSALDLAQTDEERRSIRLRRGLALAQLSEFARADAELEALIPELDGEDQVEAHLARGRSTLWTERTDETFRSAHAALDLARAQAPHLEPIALGLLSHAHGMRGDPDDLGPAMELGDRALELWAPGTRLLELSEHYHLQADTYYWTGGYERALVLSELAAATGGLQPDSAEFVLRGAGMGGLILAGLGRYEEALAAGDRAIATARRMGRGDNVVTNYSTMPLRDIFALAEARHRSEMVVGRLGPSDFNMPWMNARADLLCADLLLGDLGAVETAWPGAWDDAIGSNAWERWLVSGRLAAVRAEAEFRAERYDDAVTWARRALDMARAVQRRKYEVASLITLGRSLTATGGSSDAVAQLQAAVSLADGLGSPLFRWQARAALAEAARGVPEHAPAAEAHLEEAVRIIRAVADSLAPERAAGYLAAGPVAEVLERAG